MPSTKLFTRHLHLLLLLLISVQLPLIISTSHLPTIAISHINNKTLICALLVSSPGISGYPLNCTAFPGGHQRSYPSGEVPFSGIAAGNGFLCALSSSSNTSTMRWWEFSSVAGGNRTNSSATATLPEVKRVYSGQALGTLDSGDSHVCALRRSTGGLLCWRWPRLTSSVPKGASFTDIAVGGEFLCGMLDGGDVRCFGDGGDVVGGEPDGKFAIVAAGTGHACAVTTHGELNCWGSGSPETWKTKPSSIASLALGENRTCALQSDGRVLCAGAGGFELPGDLSGVPFMAIQAKGEAFCGILLANYSMICWGSEAFNRSHVMVYDRVLPGSCSAISSCSCGILPGTGSICAVAGSGDIAGICLPCSNPANDSPSGGGRRYLSLIIAVGAAGIAITVAVVIAGFFVFRPAGAGAPAAVTASGDVGAGASDPFSKGHSTTIEEFPLQLLQSITGEFSDEHLIGSGSFGTVYRAVLDDGRAVAIKRIAAGAGAGRRHGKHNKELAFLSELNLLSRVNHKNLVRLLGFCSEAGERALVFEFMANGTLHDHLHKFRSSSSSPIHSWRARLRVALDAARGVEYLHAYAVPPVIHRDIKSSNILLDQSWTAKVADFGLSLMNPECGGSGAGAGDKDDRAAMSVVRTAAGTVGYIDPEYYRLQNLTAKSDVYSFGVLMLELLTGCRVIQRYGDSNTPVNVVEFAVPLIAADEVHRILDPRLPPPAPAEVEAVSYVGYLAADCVATEGCERPSMTEVVGALERAVAAISSSGAAAVADIAAAAPTSLSRSSSSSSSEDRRPERRSGGGVLGRSKTRVLAYSPL